MTGSIHARGDEAAVHPSLSSRADVVDIEPAGFLPKNSKWRAAAENQQENIPPSAVAAGEALLAHMLRGERVAVLAEGQELSPTKASALLSISRPFVVLRMDRGDLPSAYVGKHRRALLKDVLALKARLDARQAAIDALTENTEDLIQTHGL